MHLSTRPSEETRTSVAVLAVHGELRTLAARDLAAGELVLELEGVLVNAPTRYTVQVGEREHLEVPADTTWEQLLARYPWRYLNHSCRPNTRLAGPGGRSLVALEAVPEGAELSFDYEANELELAEPFLCRCSTCGGHQVRGFLHLGAEDREARRRFLPPHLLRRLESRASDARMAGTCSSASATEPEPPTR